jgi:hypothetical protein
MDGYSVWFEVQPDNVTVFAIGVTDDDGNSWSPGENPTAMKAAEAELLPEFVLKPGTPTGNGEVIDIFVK